MQKRSWSWCKVIMCFFLCLLLPPLQPLVAQVVCEARPQVKASTIVKRKKHKTSAKHNLRCNNFVGHLFCLNNVRLCLLWPSNVASFVLFIALRGKHILWFCFLIALQSQPSVHILFCIKDVHPLLCALKKQRVCIFDAKQKWKKLAIVQYHFIQN